MTDYYTQNIIRGHVCSVLYLVWVVGNVRNLKNYQRYKLTMKGNRDVNI